MVQLFKQTDMEHFNCHSFHSSEQIYKRSKKRKTLYTR